MINDAPAIVYLADVQDYDNEEAIRAAIREGIKAVGVKPKGRVTTKINCVIAHKRSSPHSFTRVEVLRAMGLALHDTGEIEDPIVITERSGTRIPTKTQFRRAGYYKHLSKKLFRLETLEKAELTTVELKRSKLHETITIAKSMVDNDLLIFATKFKYNILVGGITGALKLNVGILDDTERMMFHDYRLDKKIVDLVEVGNPQLIIVDAITAGHGGSQLTSKPYEMGLIMVSNNPVAVDVVSNWIIGTDPHDVGHVVEAANRGYGPLELEDITIVGADLAMFQERAKDFETGFVPVDEFDTSMQILSGIPIPQSPGDNPTYCMGGCHGIILDELLMTKDRSNKHPHKPKKDVVVVAGVYKGDVDAGTLIYVGDCAAIDGKVNAKREVKVPGCPPTHKDLLIAMALDAGLYPDLLRLSMVIPEIGFVLPQFLRRITRPIAWKTIWQTLRYW